MKIDFANLKKEYLLYKDEIDAKMAEVIERTAFIMGPEVRELEEELSKFCEGVGVVTCASGTDALLLAMMALDIEPGDEVITTPFTFIATAETIALLKAKPVFVDIDPKTYTLDPKKIEAAITPRTKAIIPVSLYGQMADMDAINAIAKRHALTVIEDGAQSFGATYKGHRSGTLTTLATTSFFPAKPLGCFGDGGAVMSQDEALIEKITSLRVHGQSRRYHHRYIGVNGRMDTLQAAVVLAKLPHYETIIKKRREVASGYTKRLDGLLETPLVAEENVSVWAQYSIRVPNRTMIQKDLKDVGIPTAVHYPTPLHLQEAFAYLGYGPGDFPVAESIAQDIMSLPMNPYLEERELDYIVEHLSRAMEKHHV